MRRLLFTIAILCILLAFPAQMAFANTGIADDVYIKQNGSLTCTLASATMVIRARAQLCGYSDYTAITENEVYSSAWIEGAGLRSSFTYSFSENSVSMSRAVTNGGISLDSLKSILDDHPEGISLYCRGGGESTGWQDAHAVFLTDYEGNTLYCKDPAYDSGRITLGSSRLGALYGDQDDILGNVTHYWYVSSYSIKPSYVDFGDDFYAVILHYDGWMPISKVEENDKIYLKTEDGSARQIWRFQRQNDRWYEGAYVISSCYDGKVLEMHDGIRERCVQLTAQSYFWDGAYQKWYLIPYGDSYILKNCHYRDEDWVMDLYAGDAEDGNIIQINNRNNSRAQVWAIYRGDDVQLKGPKLTVTPGNSQTPSTFTWNRVYGANHYSLKIFKDRLYEGQTYHQNNADSGCGVILPAGKYFAYVDAVNYHKYKASDVIVEFTVPEAYRVQYDANGGENSPESQIKLSGEPLILQSDCPTLAEHFFLGWATSPNATEAQYQPGDTYSTDADLTLYAVWQLNEYTITYNANGGTGAPEAMTVNGGATTLSTAVPARAHHRFLGWATSADAKQAQYQPGSSYSSGTVTLYAVWQRVFDNLFVLPCALTVIEDEAFLDSAADAVVIPATVTEIGNNSFGDVAIYGYAGSYAETWARANGKEFIPIADGWVLADQVPQGARITDEKWTYQKSKTETMTSTDPNADGWTQAGFEWQQSGSGTRDCADFPAGFDRNHALYAKYTAASTDTNIRREVTSSVPVTYIYWQWAWNTELGNYYINYTSDGDENRSAYPYFHAFESATAYGQTQPNGYTDDECYYCVDYPGGSWWWYRFEVYRQTYTDYQKLFTYTRTVTSEESSAVPIAEGEGISNVQHWVKYTM